MTDLDVAVIGAGQAGLAMSFSLKGRGLRHLVFERDTIGSTWRSQRWDSFRLNTPNGFNLLPGMQGETEDRDRFCSATDFAGSLRRYAEDHDLPVREQSAVVSVEKDRDEFLVTVDHDGETSQYRCRNVVVASGSQNREVVPLFAGTVPDEIEQMHAAAFRSETTLPEGAVLVVGSGQSGVQIAEDLAACGRVVYLSTSMVARVPRRYRGRDVFEWMQRLNFFEQRPEDLTDPQMVRMKQPHISGVGPRGRTISLQSLARQGVVILGKVDSIDGDRVTVQPNGADHVRFGDAFSARVRGMVDEYIAAAQVDAPPASVDSDDVGDENAECVSPLSSFDLADHGIRSIIWATGFVGDFSYLRVPVFNDDRSLKHTNGVSAVQGLYFLGFPWLRKRKSGLIYGAGEDAAFVCDQIRR